MIHTFEKGDVVDFTDDPQYPCRAFLWEAVFAAPHRGSTYYGFATADTIMSIEGVNYWIQAGMYFCVPDQYFTLSGGLGVLIERLRYKGLFSIGGKIENKGRLRYIDGCTDTILINPPRLGDPCLNHLHFPPKIAQTMHTHPTVRIGIVAKGRGRCITPNAEYPLVPNVGWYLPVESAHCFFTDEDSMDVIAWHPDSDTGPSDEEHPMLNRTYVKGVSAKNLDDIRTTEKTEVAE
jgi:hypothetical protein